MPVDERLLLLEQMDAEARRAAGVTFNQGAVLARIAKANSAATVTRLARSMNRKVYTLGASINSLETKGLVRRYRMPGEDRRVVRIALTAKGCSVLDMLGKTSLPLT
jgi:DNA-binding MarR family transcriptional regulator